MRGVLLFVLAGVMAHAQKLDPVKWSMTAQRAGGTVLATITAEIEPGWHLYSLSSPKPSIATSVKLIGSDAPVKLYQRAAEKQIDPFLSIEVEYFASRAVFAAEFASAAKEVTAEVRYSVCDDKRCLPPVRRQVTATVAEVASVAAPSEFAEAKPPGVAKAVKPAATPVSKPPEDLAGFLAVAFGFGLAAIFTPCVFPMIPMTMSLFLGKADVSRAQSVMQAGVFCAGIIVLFTALGLGLTAALGPFGVVQLGSNPWVNGVIAAVFFVFALSMLGAFEITLPSGLLTKMNNASSGGGIAGSLLAGLVFSMSSFACVGPFMGTLLAASAQAGGARPAMGMAVFATGLAAPFFLLALFPSFLKKLPRSGGWLVRVKVVMGFVILAAMLKYLSNVDAVLQWNYLTRERFLAAWIVLFALPGLYLLGALRLEGVKAGEPLGLGRLFTAAAFLIFSISLIPGMTGAPLGDIDAYVPLPSRGFNAGAGTAGTKLEWIKNDLPAAMAKARAENKRVFVNFTGYACTNCHWMKANMFPRPEIAAALGEYVLVELFTDGADAVSEANQKVQESRFQTIAIPFYAILDADDRLVATFDRLTKDPNEFLAFLKTS